MWGSLGEDEQFDHSVSEVSLRSFAKINLFLDVIGKRSDNYHEISSVTIPILSLYDRINITPSKNLSINIAGPFSQHVDEKNNISILFDYLFKKKFIKSFNYDITIIKNIPVGAGLGGGSSNLGTILKTLYASRQLTSQQCLLIARELGSDIELFLTNRLNVAAVIHDKGKVLEWLQMHSYPSGGCLLIVYPNVILSTADVYQRNNIYSKNKTDFNIDNFMAKSDQGGFLKWIEILKNTSNDLEDAAVKLNKNIAELQKFFLEDKNCKYSRMTGSGSAFFGVYENQAIGNKSLQMIKSRFPDWFIHNHSWGEIDTNTLQNSDLELNI